MKRTSASSLFCPARWQLCLLAVFGLCSALDGGVAVASALQADAACFDQARVVDGTGAPAQPDRSLVVRGGRLVDISARRCADLGIDQVIPLAGRTVIPGLIEGHVHLAGRRSPPPEQSLSWLLAGGVTTVRDMGGEVPVLAEWQREVRAGERVGPEIFFTANFFGTSFLDDPRTRRRGYEHGEAPFMRLVKEDSDAREIVRAARETGVTGVKFYSGLTASQLSALAAEAHRQGLEVWSHAVVWPTKPSLVSASGVDQMTHAHGLFTEAHDVIPNDINLAIREWLPQQDFSTVDPGAEPFHSLFARMKERGQIFEPTLFALDERRGSGRARTDRGRSRGAQIDRAGFRRFACEVTRAAIEAGVLVSAGSDTFGDVLVIEEMVLLTRCGASELEAIRAATQINARTLGIEQRTGTLAPGKAADFVVLNSDPLIDLENLRDIHLVVQRGEIVSEGPADDN